MRWSGRSFPRRRPFTPQYLSTDRNFTVAQRLHTNRTNNDVALLTSDHPSETGDYTGAGRNCQALSRLGDVLTLCPMSLRGELSPKKPSPTETRRIRMRQHRLGRHCHSPWCSSSNYYKILLTRTQAPYPIAPNTNKTSTATANISNLNLR